MALQCARRQSSLRLPAEWSLERKSELLYGVAEVLPQVVKQASVRDLAKKTQDFVLGRCSLPATRVPPLRIPFEGPFGWQAQGSLAPCTLQRHEVPVIRIKEL